MKLKLNQESHTSRISKTETQPKNLKKKRISKGPLNQQIYLKYNNLVDFSILSSIDLLD